MKRARCILAALAAAALLGSTGAAAFSLLSLQPGSRLTMNLDLSTTPQSFIDGSLSYKDVVSGAMATWNTLGIGPGLDHNFFIASNPVIVGDACERDFVNEVKFTVDNCGDAFGSALAVTLARGLSGKTLEVDQIYDINRNWNVYAGPLRHAPIGGTIQELRRVAIHEMGHAAGLDHPDEDGQTVDAIMNSHVSNTDAPTDDDTAGAHAIQWNATAGGTTTLSVSRVGSGSGTVTSSPAGISCTPPCSASFALNSVVTLTASPAGGSIFGGWSGSCSSGGVVQMSAARSCTARFDLANALPTDSHLSTIGTRATVAGGSPLFGGFTIAPNSTNAAQRVYFVARGRSLQTLGITQDPLESPNLRVFDDQGHDALAGGGVSACPAGDLVATYYRTARNNPLDSTDACVQADFRPGVYTFTMTPTSDPSGEVLFEVLFNPTSSQAGSTLKTIGSRGTVAAGRTMYGGFTLDQAGIVMVAVRGASLTTLGITPNGLANPGLRLYNASGADLLQNTNGGTTVSACSSTNTTAQYYATTRGTPLDQRDSCIFPRSLPAGVYTFTIDPTASGGSSGEVLFEVTFSH